MAYVDSEETKDVKKAAKGWDEWMRTPPSKKNYPYIQDLCVFPRKFINGQWGPYSVVILNPFFYEQQAEYAAIYPFYLKGRYQGDPDQEGQLEVNVSPTSKTVVIVFHPAINVGDDKIVAIAANYGNNRWEIKEEKRGWENETNGYHRDDYCQIYITNSSAWREPISTDAPLICSTCNKPISEAALNSNDLT